MAKNTGQGLQSKPPEGLGPRQTQRYNWLVSQGRADEAKKEARKWLSTGAGKEYTKQPYETPQGAELRDIQYEEAIAGEKAIAPMQEEAISGLANAPDAYSDIEQIGGFDPTQQVNDYTKKAYENFMANEQANMAREQEDFEQMAANRGWTPGSEIYEAEKNRLMQQQNLQKQNLQQSAYETGATNARGDYMANIAGLAPRMQLSSGKRYGDVQDVAAARGILPDTSGYYTTKANAYEESQGRKLQREALAKSGGGGKERGGYVMPSVMPEVPSTGGSNWDMWGQLGSQILPGVVQGIMPSVTNWLGSLW